MLLIGRDAGGGFLKWYGYVLDQARADEGVEADLGYGP